MPPAPPEWQDRSMPAAPPEWQDRSMPPAPPEWQDRSMPPAPPPARPPAGDRGLDLFDDSPEPRGRRAQPEPPEDPTEIINFVDDDGYEAYEDDFADYDGYEDEGYEDEGYEDDDRAEPEYIAPEQAEEPPRKGKKGKQKRKPPKQKRKRKRGKKAFRWVAALAVLALIGGGAWYGIDKFFGYDDYTGSGDADVVVQISDGDTTGAIGTELTKAGVVASAKAFVKASEDNTKVLSLQPGYYVAKKNMSGAAAVAKLTSPSSRVGVLQIRPGTQLDDVNQPDRTILPGVFTLLSKASCADLNGKSTCVSVDDLRKAAQTADLPAMGVPDWAASAVSANTDPRRIEGLIAPGVYDVKPGWSAQELLAFALKTSVTKMQSAGLGSSSTYQQQNPYQLLVIASLVEKEGLSQDFGKIARVIYNRLAENDRLRLDSTVNYLLDKPVITTTDDDRNREGPYNTYKMRGLTPTPIASPSVEAIKAALAPPDGDWQFFVRCEKNGLSCFAVTLDEHNQNKELARQRGAY
jgi:UPF0755 protein